jgi:hypothetical protein
MWPVCTIKFRLKQWRGLAIRYEKRAVNYRAILVLASIVLWLEPRFVRQALVHPSPKRLMTAAGG